MNTTSLGFQPSQRLFAQAAVAGNGVKATRVGNAVVKNAELSARLTAFVPVTQFDSGKKEINFTSGSEEYWEPDDI